MTIPMTDADGLVYVSMAQLLQLELPARELDFRHNQLHASLLAGRHGSRLRGRGLNFEELRRYQPGDDLRHLDLRTSQRLGKPFVRSYNEERDRPMQIVLDQRMCMFFGSRYCFKSVTAAELAALTAWIGLHGGDRVGGLVFNDQHIEHIEPLRSRRQVEQWCRRIVAQNQALRADCPPVDGDSQLDNALQALRAGGGHDQLICIISDFAGASPRTLQLLRELAAHNDVLAMQVYDPLALNLPKSGRLLITQGELQAELQVGKQQVRQPLSDFFSGRLKQVAELLKRSQIPLMLFNTGEPALQQLRFELGKLDGRAR